MKDYRTFKYYYPPRPNIKTTSSGIQTYENLRMIGQAKLNGSCGCLFLNETSVKFMNRRNESFSRQLIQKEELQSLHKGNGWMYLVGEYMNKSKKNKNGEVFNGKFVIFDILVYNGKYLIGETFSERQAILDELFDTKYYDGVISQISDNIFRANNFSNDLVELYNQLITVDMYEGLVLKKRAAKLENGLRPNNNMGWQVKIRKPTANYTF